MADQANDAKPDPIDQRPARKVLTPAAERALAEAAGRRAAIDAAAASLTQVREIQGREGPEPVRFGDWENKGIASDF